MELDKIAKVKRSYARCFIGKGGLLETFYELFANEQPRLYRIIALAPERSHHNLLRKGINAMLLYAEGNYAGQVAMEDMRKIFNRSRFIFGDGLYRTMKKCLLEALEKHDPSFDLELFKLWDEVIDMSISFQKKNKSIFNIRALIGKKYRPKDS